MSVTVRPAVREDFPHIVRMIRELAAHTGAPSVPLVSEEVLAKDGPAGKDRFRILVGEVDGVVAGLCLYTFSFSGWRGKTGLFIEDLYVEPRHRGAGLAKRLLAEAARHENAGFLKLEVYAANTSALDFYRRAGFTVWDDELFATREEN